MENTMGTLTDSKDGKARSDMTLSSVNDTAATEDRIPGTETPHGESPTTSNAGKYSYNITVTGSESSTVGENIATGVFNYTVHNNEKEQEGLACDVTEGEKPKLKISVPAEDGGTMIHVDCTNGKVRHWSYCRNVDIEQTFGSRWTFGNIFDGFMAAIINGKIGDDFFDLIGKWMERYDCKVYKVYKKCLVIEFLHETEEGRDRMIKEKETVKQMFQTFIEDNKPNAPPCTLEVSTEKETTPSSDKPDTELKHIEQDESEDMSEDVSEDVSVPSTSKSEQAQAQGMMPREYKKEKQFQSVSDDESERPPKKEKKYSELPGPVSSVPLFARIKNFFKRTRPSEVRLSDETETSSPFDEASLLASEPRKKSRGKKSRDVEREPIPVSQVHLPDEEEIFSSFHSEEEATSYLFDGMALRPFMSLSLADNWALIRKSSVGLRPIPVSQVHLCDCRGCSEVLWTCEKELSTLKNIFFIHFDPTLEEVRLNALQLQFTKILSAFRNSQGGVLIVHQSNTPDSEDSLYKFINQISDSVLTHDLVTCDVFKSLQIGNYENVFRIDVEPAEMFVTHDYKTKFPSLSTVKFENASNERIRHLLFSPRTTESTVPALKDISSKQQHVKELRLRYTGPTPMLSYHLTPMRHMLNVQVDDIDVDDIMTSHSVPEHITSLSKKNSGGSMSIVMAGLKFKDTPLRQQERIKNRLMQTLKENLHVQKNKHSKVSLQDIDVFKIGLSKDAGSGGCIIEIAVGHVNGCVFHDPKGPESYKIEGERVVRLPIERWVEEAFE